MTCPRSPSQHGAELGLESTSSRFEGPQTLGSVLGSPEMAVWRRCYFFSEDGLACLWVGSEESEALKSPDSLSVLQETVSPVKRQRSFSKSFLPSPLKDMFLGQMSVSQEFLTPELPGC